MVEKKLISAEAARRQTVDNTNNEKNIKLWNSIVVGIEKAITNGCYNYVITDEPLPEFMIEKLEKLGYEVKKSSPLRYGECHYNINWRK